MSTWSDYKPEEGGSRLEAGDYRCVVTDVEDTVSKAGNPMIVVTVMPNGSTIKIKHYMVKNKYFNRNITEFFDSFGIERGDFNMPGWVGAVGAAKFVKDENDYLKVRWFLKPGQAKDLPEWVGPKPERQTVTDLDDFSIVDGEDDLPF